MNISTHDPIESWLRSHLRLLWTLAAIVFILPMSIYAMLVYVEGSDFLGMGGRSAASMVDQTAIKPHIYRQMVPAMARGVSAITPVSFERDVADYLNNWLHTPRSMFRTMVDFHHRGRIPKELHKDSLYNFAVITVIDYLFFLSYIFFTWKLAALLFPHMFSVRILAGIFAVLAIPPFSAKFAYIYDYPVLCFSALMSCLLLQGRITLFTIFIAISTFNKETSIYLWALFILYGYKTLPRQQWLYHGCVQLLLIVSIKTALTLIYSGNAGHFIWTHGAYDHIITSLDGYPVYSYVSLLVGVILLGYRWEDKPYMLKCWLALLPPIVFAWLEFGMRNEYRVMFEMFPALIVASCHSIVHITGWHESKTLRHC